MGSGLSLSHNRIQYHYCGHQRKPELKDRYLIHPNQHHKAIHALHRVSQDDLEPPPSHCCTLRYRLSQKPNLFYGQCNLA